MEFNGTFLASIITFIVFVFLMNKVLYAPILGIMEERRALIKGNYDKAEDNNAHAEKIFEEKSDMLNSAKETARVKYFETLDGYKTQRSKIVTEAQVESRAEQERAENELISVSGEAKSVLKDKMTELAGDIVEKVLGYRCNIEQFDNEEVDRILYQ